MSETIEIIRGHAGFGERLSGKVLSANDGFSARYDLDRANGVFSRPAHKLYQQSYVDKILVLNMAKGGVASAWMLHQMVKMGKSPKAILFNFVNPVIAQGAALAGISLMDRFDCDITAALRTGDEVEIDPKAGEVHILRRERP
jgi:predicted aconitase with swiveling domain